jgi:undecaprenyl-diphosphatase
MIQVDAPWRLRGSLPRLGEARAARDERIAQGEAVTLFAIAILALVQGITEFLPISSHGHLIVARSLLGLDEPGLIINIAVHVGTLGAVMVYFRRDVRLMLIGVSEIIMGEDGAGRRLLITVLVATVPVLVAGYFVMTYLGEELNTIAVIGWTTLGFAVLLYFSDRIGMTMRRIEHMGLAQALIIGLFQVLALVPGTSRSGITMTAARLLGLERTEAARFSLLLSIPAILGAGALAGIALYQAGDARLQAAALLAAAFAFLAALAAISLMMAWLRRATFTPFVIYRVVLGAVLLIWVYFFQAGP